MKMWLKRIKKRYVVKEMELNHKGDLLRALRHLSGQPKQTEVAAEAGIALNTLIAAERGVAYSDRTWNILVEYYRSLGCQFTTLPDGLIIIAWRDAGDHN